MTRTVLTSIARTCPACGTTNTVVAATTEIRPAWPMNCSRCGAAIANRAQQRQAERSAGHRAPAAAGPETRPAVGAAPKTARRRRRGGLSRCCSGLHMAAGAALGVLCTALLLDFGGGPASHRKAADAVVLTAALEAPAFGPAVGAPVFPADHRSARAPEGSPSPAREVLRIETARADPPGRGGIDRDPRLADGGSDRTPVDPQKAAVAEAALDLSRRQRREVQRRLALAQHDPRLVDGIFGPATRAAITGWQIAAGLPPTGYLDTQAVALLEDQTEDRYRAWRQAERDRSRQRTAAAASPVPHATPASAGKCQRTWSGEIAYGQNVRCDLRGLRENVKHLLRLERS